MLIYFWGQWLLFEVILYVHIYIRGFAITEKKKELFMAALISVTYKQCGLCFTGSHYA